MDETLTTLSEFLIGKGFTSSKGNDAKYIYRKGDYFIGVSYYVGSGKMLYTVNGLNNDVEDGFGSQVYDTTMSYSIWIQKNRDTLVSVTVADDSEFPVDEFKKSIEEYLTKLDNLA